MRRCVLAVMLVLAAVSSAGAGEPITIGERVVVQSRILGEERTILVSTPPNYEQGRERYPVLYMTDGNAHLSHTRGTVDFLVRNGLMPDVIIVAVVNTDRTRDLTPTPGTLTEDDGTVREFPTSGGAPVFLDFFERELFPYIDAAYRTQPMRLFAGHSFGGLLALHTFLNRPAAFNAVIAVSPSLRWDDELMTRQAREFFADRTEHPVTLFVSMGNEEEGDPRPNMLDRFEEVLESASATGFEWQVKRMPEETHGTVVLRSHYWGLRKVFDGWQLPADSETGAFTGTVADLKAHYRALSERYGFQILPPELTVNRAGYQALGLENSERAISIFRYNVELYPDSANVHDSLGEALENAGQLEEAAACYERAVKNAVANDDDRLQLFTTNRDRVLELLGARSARAEG